MLENKESYDTDNIDGIKSLKPTEFVTMSNELIDASYKLSLIEHRLYNYLLSKIKKSDPNWMMVSINVKEFADKFNIEHKAIYAEVRKAARSLQNSQITIKTSKNKSSKSRSNEEPYLYVSWLASAQYDNGILEAEFSQKLEPYILELKSNFTKCNIDELSKFSSVYAIKLYQVLKRYAEFDYNVKEFSIEEFRFALALGNKYPKFSNLKIRVIDSALDEINNKSDITITMNTLKKGKKVTGMKFIVNPKVNKPKEVKVAKKEPKVDDSLIVTVKTLLGTIMSEVKDNDAIVLLQEAENDINKIMKQIMNVQASKSPIENTMGFLRAAIRGQYEPINLSSKKGAENNIKNYTDDSENEDWDEITRMAGQY